MSWGGQSNQYYSNQNYSYQTIVKSPGFEFDNYKKGCASVFHDFTMGLWDRVGKVESSLSGEENVNIILKPEIVTPTLYLNEISLSIPLSNLTRNNTYPIRYITVFGDLTEMNTIQVHPIVSQKVTLYIIMTIMMKMIREWYY